MSPRQLVRRPTPGHRGEGPRSRRSAITTAADARMPMAEPGERSSGDRDVRPYPAVSPARRRPVAAKTDDMPTS